MVDIEVEEAIEKIEAFKETVNRFIELSKKIGLNDNVDVAIEQINEAIEFFKDVNQKLFSFTNQSS